jgi:AcrR family transcriptional regulator
MKSSLVESRLRQSTHPTKRQLLDTTSRLLDNFPVTRITSDQVLRESGISKGSMYHFFHDFDQLLEETQAERFAHWNNDLTEKIKVTLANVDSVTKLKKALAEIMNFNLCPKQNAVAMENFRSLGIASGEERFALQMREVQERVSEALEVNIGKALLRIEDYPKKITTEKLTLLVELWICGRSIGYFHKRPIEDYQWGELTDSLLNCLLNA